MTRPEQMNPGQHYLAHETDLDEWSLWQKPEDGAPGDYKLVGWNGVVVPEPFIDGADWPQLRHFRFHLITEQQATTMLDAAAHMHTEDVWWRHAARVAKGLGKTVG